MAITLPYRFDTVGVWHTILKGAFGLNAILLFGIALKLASGQWPTALGLVVVEAVVFWFSRLFVRYQDGSVGTLHHDRVEVEPNALFGITLPGPGGTYTMDRFTAIRVQFLMGAIVVTGSSPGPHELVWLAGRPGTPDVLLARTDDRAGRTVGAEFATLLSLPVEEKDAPKVVTLQR